MPKIQIKLINKTELSPQVYLLTFETESELVFTPGQFISVEIEPKINRPYSISYLGKDIPYFEGDLQAKSSLSAGNYLTLMISTKPGGAASDFFEKIKPGVTLNAIGPTGRFALVQNNRPKVFVATGTGLAPFTAMTQEIIEKDSNADISVFFGCWDLSGDFVHKFFIDLKSRAKNLKVYTVAENLEGISESEFLKEGRVTKVIPETINNLNQADFYLCGHPAMVASMSDVLLKNKVLQSNIIMEKFGK
ncbi:MAG: FAD-dependent oxidoreductase [Patescibacteria group bacterium]